MERLLEVDAGGIVVGAWRLRRSWQAWIAFFLDGVDSDFTTNDDGNDTPSRAGSMEQEGLTRRNASWVFFFYSFLGKGRACGDEPVTTG